MTTHHSSPSRRDWSFCPWSLCVAVSGADERSRRRWPLGGSVYPTPALQPGISRLGTEFGQRETACCLSRAYEQLQSYGRRQAARGAGRSSTHVAAEKVVDRILAKRRAELAPFSGRCWWCFAEGNVLYVQVRACARRPRTRVTFSSSSLHPSTSDIGCPPPASPSLARSRTTPSTLSSPQRVLTLTLTRALTEPPHKYAVGHLHIASLSLPCLGMRQAHALQHANNSESGRG